MASAASARSCAPDAFRALHACWRSSGRLLRVSDHTSSKIGSPRKRVVIEFSSPNIAKPFHVGHLRSTFIGQTLANAISLAGHDVVKLNWLGDWGGQFGLLATALADEGKMDARKLTTLNLYDSYVNATTRAKADPDYAAKAKNAAALLDSGEPTLLNFWREIRKLSLDEFNDLYARLGISFDSIDSESDYATSSKELMKKWVESGRLENRDGYVGVSLGPDAIGRLTDHVNRKSIPAFVNLIKPDGSSLYLARDIAAVLDRMERYDFDHILYVVGAEQRLHMALLKVLVEFVAGLPDVASRIRHVAFSKVSGMSTRDGTAVFVEELLKKGATEVDGFLRTFKNPKINDDNRERIVNQLANGAWIVKDFSHGRSERYKFSWAKALAQKSSNKEPTILRLQYCYARLCSLVDRAAESGIYPVRDDLSADLLSTLSRDDRTRACVDQLTVLANSPDVLLETLDPKDFLLVLFRTVDAVNVAFRECQVISSTKDVAESRLTLFAIARDLLAESARLVCIEPLREI